MKSKWFPTDPPDEIGFKFITPPHEAIAVLHFYLDENNAIPAQIALRLDRYAPNGSGVPESSTLLCDAPEQAYASESVQFSVFPDSYYVVYRDLLETRDTAHGLVGILGMLLEWKRA